MADREPNIQYLGGSGECPDEAVVILAPGDSAGVHAEYEWLESNLGPRGESWQLQRQALMEINGQYYDRLDIQLADGARRSFFFNITDFFGEY